MDIKKYIGMDVHKETISIAVMNGEGKLVMESIIETKAITILQFVQGLRGDFHVTFAMTAVFHRDRVEVANPVFASRNGANAKKPKRRSNPAWMNKVHERSHTRILPEPGSYCKASPERWTRLESGIAASLTRGQVISLATFAERGYIKLRQGKRGCGEIAGRGCMRA